MYVGRTRNPQSGEERTIRRFVAVGIPVILVGALTGCSAFFPSDVTPSESASSGLETAACSQEDAQLTWHPKQEAAPADYGYRTVTVALDESETTVDTELGYAASVTSDDFRSKAYFDTDWVDFVLDEFGRTGQTVAGSKDATDYFDSARPSEPALGVTIIGYQQSQVQVAFDLRCAGAELGSGWLTTIGGELHTTMIFCGDEVAEATTQDELYLKELHSYCPAS